LVATPALHYSEPGTGPGIWGVDFVDVEHGFLYGTSLLRTTDGGRVWHGLRTPGPILDLEPGAGGVVYALVQDRTEAGATARAHLYRLAAGSDALVPAGPRAGVDADWWSLAVQGTAVYLLAPTAGADPPLSWTLWSSRDGGASWRHASAPCAWPGADGGALAAWSDRGLALACGSEPGAGNQSKTFYASTDGGLTWHLTGRLAFGPGYIADLAAAGPRDWLLSEARGTLEVSGDGGRRWREAMFRGSQSAVEGWGAVSFTGAGHAVALPWTLNGSVLGHSADAGATWTETHFPSGR
jgi:hypothetical protein